MRYEVLASTTGKDGLAVQFKPEHALPLTFTTDRLVSFVAPENSTMASRVLVRFAEKEPTMMLEAFVELASAIAPRVNRRAIRARSPEARLAQRLFDLDGAVLSFLGRKHAPTFYQRTREAWKWNSRYWEQCALLELEKFRSDPRSSEGSYALDLAVQHARHAVAIERHPFTLTTLGNALFAQMTVEGATRARDCYTEGFDMLYDAIELAQQRDRIAIHPFIVMFKGANDYARGGGQLSSAQHRRLQAMVDEARDRFATDGDVKEALTNLGAALEAFD